ncbi:hypothetical protein PHMEG_00014069 [Phytophthora megakarya]|uniref:Uncharacterized protein n=1 Tax=Phytophthora megakarya TaxID=4795 RepID=A0A225W5T3_9STRA|nr:hypothetical protein PHMEG_00014069 [Phytophthora megakarya]
MFMRLNSKPTTTQRPMRVMIKLEHGNEAFNASWIEGALVASSTALSSRVSFDLVKDSTTSEGSISVRYRIPQLKSDSIIFLEFEVLPDLRDKMVIGRDLMAALNLVVDFGTRTVC